MDILTLNNGKMPKKKNNNRCSTWKHRYVTLPFIKTIMKAIQEEHVDSVQLNSAGPRKMWERRVKNIITTKSRETENSRPLQLDPKGILVPL
jgi:hypothetical protein